jgi:hypothetical protein
VSGVPAALRQELEEGAARLRAALADVPDARWTVRPAAEAWSIADVVEHLVLVERAIQGLLASRFVDAAADDRDPDPEATERRIRRAMGNRVEIRAKSPEPFAPTGRWPAAAALREEMGRTRDATLAFARACTADLRRHRSPHPGLGPLDGIAWLVFVSVHADRHLDQVREIEAATRGAS